MKSCHGCKYLRRNRWCYVGAGQMVRIVDPHTGASYYGWTGFGGSGDGTPGIVPPTVTEMRTGGSCGPDATRWEPVWWRRLLGQTRPGDVRP